MPNDPLEHDDKVTGVAFAPDGTTLASGPFSGKVWLWQVGECDSLTEKCGTLLNTLEGHLAPVWNVAFSPDGTILASGGGMVQFWRVADGNQLYIQSGHMVPVSSIAFSPDGNILASGTEDGVIWLWQVQK